MKIVANNVDKHFGKFKAIDKTDIVVESGTIHGLLGSNGAGKTTLMKVLAGIYKADNGTVLYDDAPIFENVSTKRDVLFINDIPFYFPGATINKMAEYYRAMYPNFSNTRFNTLCELFKLNPKKSLSQMSKGMKRQASFILAFSSKPKVMLLDEPFDGLDPIVRRQIKNIMMQDIANHGLTVLASSHNLREMEDLCDAVSIMHEGHVLISQDLNEVKGSHCKLQIAFKELPSEDFYKDLNVVHKSIKVRIITCILRGDISNVEEKVSKYNPLMYDILPLTLEEIFAYEMGEIGYEIENIIIE